MRHDETREVARWMSFGLMLALGIVGVVAIVHPWITRTPESAAERR